MKFLDGRLGIRLRGDMHGCDNNEGEFSWEIIRSTLIVRNSRSGEQKDLSSCMLFTITLRVVNHETYTPALLLTGEMFIPVGAKH